MFTTSFKHGIVLIRATTSTGINMEIPLTLGLWEKLRNNKSKNLSNLAEWVKYKLIDRVKNSDLFTSIQKEQLITELENMDFANELS